MESDRRTRLTPGERRAQLVALGVGVLADHPLDALTIPYLSAQAGVSRGLLFYYFGSEAGLHREVVTTASDSMLHATEPVADLPPLERLHDTLTRLVQFVREHRGTFYSLVRGMASGDLEVRELIDEARSAQADRVIAAFLELGVADSTVLRLALRSWVAFAEQTLVDSADLPPDEVVAFLERSASAVVASVSAS